MLSVLSSAALHSSCLAARAVALYAADPSAMTVFPETFLLKLAKADLT